MIDSSTLEIPEGNYEYDKTYPIKLSNNINWILKKLGDKKHHIE